VLAVNFRETTLRVLISTAAERAELVPVDCPPQTVLGANRSMERIVDRVVKLIIVSSSFLLVHGDIRNTGGAIDLFVSWG
jgi:hypothetical protein